MYVCDGFLKFLNLNTKFIFKKKKEVFNIDNLPFSPSFTSFNLARISFLKSKSST